MPNIVKKNRNYKVSRVFSISKSEENFQHHKDSYQSV